MKKFICLSCVIFFPILLIIEAVCIGNFFAHTTIKLAETDWRASQKIQIALVIVSFHSYYHTWPCPPGPLGIDAGTELGGFQLSKINVQHINFFEKNNCTMLLTDAKGHPLCYKPDDSIGTCTIFEDPRYSKK